MTWVRSRKTPDAIAEEVYRLYEEMKGRQECHVHEMTRRLQECLYVTRHVSARSPQGFAQGRDPAIVVRDDAHQAIVQRVTGHPGLYMMPGNATLGYQFSAIFNFVDPKSLSSIGAYHFDEWMKDLKLKLIPQGVIYHVL